MSAIYHVFGLVKISEGQWFIIVGNSQQALKILSNSNRLSVDERDEQGVLNSTQTQIVVSPFCVSAAISSACS